VQCRSNFYQYTVCHLNRIQESIRETRSISIIEFSHQGPESLRVGVIVADGVSVSRYADSFESDLADLLEARHDELDNSLDTWRREIRDVFRNGKFKPTGRGKPASEYLLGAARKDAFPRINSIVDACNYVSLRFVLPISVCDLDRAGADRFMVRLGLPDEEYVFNTTGQTINVEDLIVGCSVSADGSSRPIINAVKDSMGSKTTPESSRIFALLYAPKSDSEERLANATSVFEQLLGACGDSVKTASAVVTPGVSIVLDVASS